MYNSNGDQPIKYYRHQIERWYNDIDGDWNNIGWEFSTDSPQEFLNRHLESEKEYRDRNPESRMTSRWRLKISHEIDKESYDMKLGASIPINQYIFF